MTLKIYANAYRKLMSCVSGFNKSDRFTLSKTFQVDIALIDDFHS